MSAASVGDRFFDQQGAREEADEIVLVQTLPAEDGRRGTGHEQSKKLEELVKNNEGRIRSLDQDGPFSLFQETFALEVRGSARREMLAELGAIEGIEFHSLPKLLNLAAQSEARPLPDAATLAGFKDRLEKGRLDERLQAFAELASILESATPEQIAALPAQTRDELVLPIYEVAGAAVNTYNLVQGAARRDIRKRLHDARPEREDGWAGLEKAAQEEMKDPAVRARFLPLRTLLTRALGAMDRLDTPRARATLTQILPHADHAALEFVASDPARRERYVREWLASISDSIDETEAGLRLGASRHEGWTGNNRSGGYTHVAGRRQSSHLYQWRRGRFDPAEMHNELLLTLGMPGGETLTDLLLPVLEAFQLRMPELEALNKEQKLTREYARVESNLESYKRQAADGGRPLPDEVVARYRAQMREEVEERYAEHDRMDGHSVIDRLLLSLSYSPFHAQIPGFDEAVFVANALRFYEGANRRLDEPGLVRQLTDSAVNFLTAIADRPVLDSRPGLRASAVATWKAVAAKARELGITLNTRMDGVIDPRGQTLLGEPALLDGAGKDSTVWQLAVSHDGAMIARAAGDRSVKIWDARTKALLKTIQLDDARQLYGDLANSLGAAWTSDGRLLVTTLHDGEKDGVKFGYNLVRTFDLSSVKSVLTPEDARTSAQINDAYVLREMAEGPRGPFYATIKELRNEQHHYLGAEVRLVDADGHALALIENATLLGLSGKTLLTAAPGRSTPALGLWNVADPRNPVDATPDWLRERVAAWRERNPRSEYGWWPTISAKLGSFQGRPVLVLHDEGKLQLLDLETGAVLRALEVPNDWDASPYLTDTTGKYLAAVVKAPGQFSGPNPERLMIWDLATGEIVMERDATYVPQGWVYMRGQSIGQLAFSADGKSLVAAGRQSVQVFSLP